MHENSISNSRIFPFLIVLFCLFLMTNNAPSQRQAGIKPEPPYLNTELPIVQRVDDLVSRMTLEEKTSQLFNGSPGVPRLQVPAYNWWSEGLHGVGLDGAATVFPQAIGLAATWDRNLLHGVATAIGTEARARYHEAIRQGRRVRLEGLTFWSPNINIFRDPRWGRGQETYGEDPFLTARMGVAFVTGMQGDDPKYLQVITTPKHFAAYSGPEPLRHKFNVEASKHDLMDTYFPAFRAAVVEGKAGSVMCAYNSINGEPACANTFMLQNQLRGAWHFNGYVVSDCGAMGDIDASHHFRKNRPESVAVSLKRGTDLDCDFGGDSGVYLKAVQQGLLRESDIDLALKRLLRARFQLGMFDPPTMVKYAQTPFSENDSEDHRLLSLQAARESIVLLKNNSILPFKKPPKKIAVIGPLADTVTPLLGSYNGTPSRYTTVLEGIRQRFPGAQISYTPGTQFLLNAYAVPAKLFSTEDGKSGLSALYFANKDLSGSPVVRRVDSQLNFGFGVYRLPDAVASRDFSARWTGILTPPDSGTYELVFRGRGGLRLWLDGKAVFDDWTEPANASTPRTTEVHLEKARHYLLKVEFFRSAVPDSDLLADVASGGASLLWRRMDGSNLESAVVGVREADVVVAVVGITPELENEEMSGKDLPEGFKGGDRTSLNLPRPEEELLKAAKAMGKPLVVVLMNGSALAVNWANQNADAILEAWYPGEEGGRAIAETLAGDNNPAGRLPVTFYRNVDDLPPFEDYSMQGRTYRYFKGTPLYAFGYGLSYSSFAYGKLKLSAKRLKAGESLKVTVDVQNTSTRDGDEVAELYLTFPRSSGTPLRALRGFQRVQIKAGQQQHLEFNLGPRDLSWVDHDGNRRVGPGDYTVYVGGGQPGTTAPISEVHFLTVGAKRLSD